MERELRVMFLDGPGNLMGAYQSWARGAEFDRELARTYSAQFFNVMRRWNARVHAIAWPSGDPERIDDGQFIIEHRPQPAAGAKGASFHLGLARWATGIMRDAVRFKADLVFLDHEPPPYLFAPLRLLVPHVAIALHCTLWPAGNPPRELGKRIVLGANGFFFKSCADMTLAISPECERQVLQVASRARGPILQYLPRFSQSIPAGSLAPKQRPFRVLLSSRIERSKGVFDALEVATRLHRKRPQDFRWSFCGTGSGLEQLRAEVDKRGLGGVVDVMGHLDRRRMLEQYTSSSAVMVPTTADFPEGMAKVALEAALAGRPVVASSTVPAGEVLGDAALVVPAGDIEGYQRALERLADDEALYVSAAEAALNVSESLLSNDFSFESQLDRTMDSLFGQRMQALQDLKVG